MLDVTETIVAIASARGSATRGIIRLSGPDAVGIAASVFEADNDPSWSTALSQPTALVGRVTLALGREMGVSGQLLVWPDARSYTRQPSAELHVLGAPPLLQLLLEQLCVAGARLAEPGEFTLRAFLSGRLDLTQAEAVLAVIDAESESQFDTALEQLAGGLAGPLGKLREDLISVLAELEAGLDFVEEDIEFISDDQLERELSECQMKLTQVVDQIDQRDVTVESASVVLIGKPNSGKSSLFNRLTGSALAIVTDVAGTTTDFISQSVTLAGHRVKLIDTAGEEEATGEISAAAQSHRGRQKETAEIRLLCIDVDGLDGSSVEDLSWYRRQIAALHGSDIVVLTKSDRLTATNKQDLGLGGGMQKQGDAAEWLAGRLSSIEGDFAHVGPRVALVSSQSGEGLEGLESFIVDGLERSVNGERSVVDSTVQRASESLRLAASHLEAALEACRFQLGEEIVAAEIREVLNALGLVVGVVYTDDILDLVFGRFCIGK